MNVYPIFASLLLTGMAWAQLESNPTQILQEAGALALLGFVLWFTFHRIERSIENLNQTIWILSEIIRTTRRDQLKITAQIEKELHQIEKELEHDSN